jgi:hypothetical protein
MQISRCKWKGCISLGGSKPRRQDREKRPHPAVDVLVEVPLGQVLVSLLGGTVHAAHRSSLEQKYNESVRGYEEGGTLAKD